MSQASGGREAVESFVRAVVRADDERAREHVAPGSDVAALLEVFGCAVVQRLFGGGEAGRIEDVGAEGDGLRVIVSFGGSSHGASVWLTGADGRWLVTDVLAGDARLLGRGATVPDDVLALYGGVDELPIACEDPVVRDLLVLLRGKRHRSEQSIFEAAGYLAGSKQMLVSLEGSGYALEPGVRATGNNDVFRGVRRSDGLGVGIKSSRHAGDPMRTNFLREIAVLQALRGEAIAPHLLENGESGGRPYFVYAWVEGRVLQDLVAAGPGWSVAERIGIIHRLVAALLALERRGVIHRDVATDHVLVQDDGDVRLIDFGMARFLDRTEPARARRRLEKEIRNAGITLAYVLTDATEQGYGDTEAFLDVWRRAIERVAEAGLPEPVTTCVRRCIAADPDCRVITGPVDEPIVGLAELHDELDRILGQLAGT